jgi:hypothetical protein
LSFSLNCTYVEDCADPQPVDRLIDRGDLEPTVIVTPNFYNLGFTEVQFETNATLAAKYEDVGKYFHLYRTLLNDFKAQSSFL